MRFRVGVVLALLLAPWQAATPAWAQRAATPPAAPGGGTQQAAPRPPQDREALIVNELGLGLRELYIAPAGSVEPGPDRLGQDTLPTGASLRVGLGRQRLCLFDVRAVLADGSAEEKRGVDLCRSNRVTFGDPTAPLREAQVVNDTDLTIREFYAMPSAPQGRGAEGRGAEGRGAPPAARGPDRLGAEMVGAEATFTLRLGRARECLYDMTAVYEDDTQEEKRRVDLCRRNRVVFGDSTIPWREVEVVNSTQRTLRNLYAAPLPAPGAPAPTPPATAEEREERWGPDRLGQVTVGAGETFRLRLRRQSCQADLRVVYNDEQAEEKTAVDICGGAKVVFDGGGIERQPERAFTLVNRHGAPVQELYASSVDDTDWGDDRLPGGPLERGGRFEVSLRAGCEIDLRVVFGNGGAEERRGVNICDNGLIVVRPGWTLAERLDQGAGAIEQGPPREGSVRFRNSGPAPLVELYVDAAGTPRGADRLGATVLGRGETLDFQPPEGVGCTGHLRAVFRNGLEIDRPDFALCSGTEVPLP
ncbi:hypothetical protein [Roseomonas sp. 18066]|uniref:hypothetical protein n=1 Tax=Roseomonas sp. 18066 TaxID=2681412 RepID=UPI0013591D38|nr:hypothetical protein [Roseomonas sp. 18066]